MRKALTIGLAIAALCAVGYFAFYLQGWETYENTSYGFRVQYPGNWNLGEADENNSGQAFNSPDQKAYCYAYGFPNALLNTNGEPQTLEEFIDWLIENLHTKLLKKEAVALGDRTATHYLAEEEDGIREAVYALNDEIGWGLFCTYADSKSQEKYQDIFANMKDSFRISDLSEVATSSMENCEILLDGSSEPLRDFVSLTDTDYPEVTVTSRNAWDRSRLPAEITRLEDDAYSCLPLPVEFAEADDSSAEPAVTKVEWQCELRYQNWKYLPEDSVELTSYEGEGFKCTRQACTTASGKNQSVWLCTK
ncbi:MAG: hypothetical protein K9L85_00195 [Candidatus Peribacteraceae bacterium]|nr:hypothetical protein [Candidatus Peribacteraceae bacterium]